MDKITKFKEFVKQHPSLVKYVNDGSMNWQKFYEMYDLYDENHEIWNSYFSTPIKEDTKAAEVTGFADILTWIKGINLDKMQEGINSVQRVLGVLGDFSSKENSTPKPEYKPRPLYKHFED